MRIAGWTPTESDLDLLDMVHEIAAITTAPVVLEVPGLMWKAFEIGRRYADHKRYEEENL